MILLSSFFYLFLLEVEGYVNLIHPMISDVANQNCEIVMRFALLLRLLVEPLLDLLAEFDEFGLLLMRVGLSELGILKGFVLFIFNHGHSSVSWWIGMDVGLVICKRLVSVK